MIQASSTDLGGRDPHTKPCYLPKFFDTPFETLPKSSFPRWNEVSDGLGSLIVMIAPSDFMKFHEIHENHKNP